MTDLLNGIEICVSVISEIECLAYPGISEDEKEGIKSFLQECTIVGLTNEVKEFTIDLNNIALNAQIVLLRLLQCHQA